MVTQILEKTISQPGEVSRELIENFLICISKNMLFTFMLILLSLFLSVFGNSISWNWTVGVE